MIRIYSFDVYDTLLTRPLLRPTDLFYVVGMMFESKQHDFSPNAYKVARQQAEQNARKASRPRDDCRFTDIFLHFQQLAKWGISAQTAMNAELEVERTMTRSIVANAIIARTLVEAGEKVVFLSDMYLPGDFIWELLCENIVSCERESIFVSGDLGLAKYSGRLFKHVLDRYSITPNQLQHFGDNEHSDFHVPRKLGIGARAYVGIKPTRYERLSQSSKKAPIWLSVTTGVARATRLSIANNDESATVARVASNVVGPILTAYVTWVLNNARAQGVERLYFVSRDGQILQKIASVIRDDTHPECRYLYGSRQAWLLPSVLELTPANLDWAWTIGMPRRGNDILRRLEIDTPDAYSILARKGFNENLLARQLYDVDFDRFRSLLLKPPLSDMVLERARRQRALTQAYLRQEGLFDSKCWALVDVGWALKCQHALGQILTSFGYNEQVRGYYFGVGNNHIPLDKHNIFHAFVTPPSSDLKSRFTAKWFFKLTTIILIEHLFTTADHPTVCSYKEINGKLEPVYKYETQNDKVFIFARAMHEAVIHYAKELKMNSLVDASSLAFSERAFTAMRDFCMQPEFDDVAGVAWLPTNKDQSHDEQHISKLASPLQLRDLWTMVCYELLPRHEAFFNPHFAWFAGSAAISKKPIRWLYHILYELNKIRSIIR